MDEINRRKAVEPSGLSKIWWTGIGNLSETDEMT